MESLDDIMPFVFLVGVALIVIAVILRFLNS